LFCINLLRYRSRRYISLHHDVNTNVVDSSVVQHSDGLPSLEVYDCLEELESLGLIKMLQPIGDTKEKKDSETFRLLNITKEGLEELQPNQ
jgi:hypothetical protein